MNPRSFPFLLAAIAFLAVSASAQEDAIKTAIKTVKEKYAPDRRVAVFDIPWEMQGSTLVLKGEIDNPEAKAALLSALQKAVSVSVADSIRLLPDPALGEKLYGIVILSVGNVRSKPDHAEELSTQVLMGTTIKLLKRGSGYHYVQMPDMYLGWIDGAAFTAVTRAEADAWAAAQKVIMTENYGVVREEPNTTALPVCDLVAGGILKAGTETGGWTAVELADGRKGFIESALVQEYRQWKNSRILNGESIARTSKTFLGVPYLWGGTSSKGMDCSGFTKTVYRLNGVELNRDASQQVRNGEEVVLDSSFSTSRKGDLLFFGQKATSERSERITHVGIYLENKKFIHSSGRVRFGSFDPSSPMYEGALLKRLVRSRRIITDPTVPEVRK
jgi:hypothetical protein